MTTFSDLDLYFWQSGEHTQAYEKFGAHPIKHRNKILGFHFSVYAPNAKKVYVIGDFNNWQNTHEMHCVQNGVFALFIEGMTSNQRYKYLIDTGQQQFYKADPYGRYHETRPNTASITYNPRYKFKDDLWMYHRVHNDHKKKPLSIYEVHLGSWQQKVVNKNESGASISNFYSYREIAPLLVEYVKKHHFTHIELLPLMEHPFDGSWGYQITGYFSPTSRYGKPDDLKYFVDYCHQNGIGVILDWVPLHFCKDAHGLYQFDGTWLYEYEKEYDRENTQWGTANFDLSKGITRSFLLSNIHYWLKEYHFDGIRVDALSYLLYWRGETTDSHINHEAVNFIKRVNAMVHTEFKGVMMIAEDSSSYPNVTTPVNENGIGFDYKWDLGWMNDTLNYFKLPSVHRPYHSNRITFGMFYHHQENYILPLSHDEVVHSKFSIVDKMNGEYEDKFDQARAYYSHFYAHPGKKLLFMGNEWGHIREWHEHTEMDWLLLQYPIHSEFLDMMTTLLKLYKDNSAFWERDDCSDGFEWVNINEQANCYIYRRLSDTQEILVANNFNDQEVFNLPLGLPNNAVYQLLFSSNRIPTQPFELHVTDGIAYITIPRYTTFYLKRIR